MADDGTGRSIHIPSFLIRKADAEIILSAMTSSSVYVKGIIDIAHPDNRVEYDLWYSSILDLDTSFIEDMSRYALAFGNNTYFTPRIFTYTCEDC